MQPAGTGPAAQRATAGTAAAGTTASTAAGRPAEHRDRRSGAFNDRERADSSPRGNASTATAANSTAGPEQLPRSPHEREREAYIANSGFRPDAASAALVQRFKTSGASPPFVPPLAAPR